MKYRNTFRPAACAGKPSASNRYTIEGAAVVEHNGAKYLAATDGRILSFVPVELDDDDKPEGAYPVAAFQAATKAAGKSGEARMTVNGVAKVTGPDGSVATFPKLESRFPDVAGMLGSVLWPKGTTKPHGTRNGTADSTGGYALRSRWL